MIKQHQPSWLLEQLGHNLARRLSLVNREEFVAQTRLLTSLEIKLAHLEQQIQALTHQNHTQNNTSTTDR